MTNSLKKMAGKNSAERNGTPGRPRSTSKLRPIKSLATPPRKIETQVYNNSSSNEVMTMIVKPQRLSPTSAVSPPVVAAAAPLTPPNPARISPGLVAGYFAGGKWSEPPSPATLPKPPRHWTQLMFASKCAATSLELGGMPQQTDIASQLKVLLNVQA